MKSWQHDVLIVLITLAAAGVIWLISKPPRGEAIQLAPLPTAAPMVINISGAVAEPGVYSLPVGSRVSSVLELAGGITDQGDTSKLNLASLLSDGQHLYVPEKSEHRTENVFVPTEDLPIEPSFPININLASEEELALLPGIGPILAEAICTYRDEHGPFQTIEDIELVSGIGPGKFSTIKDKITITGF